MSAQTELTICLAEADNDPLPCLLDADHKGLHKDISGSTWRHRHKYGPADVYEITWMSGHVERILAHQVAWPDAGLALTRSMLNVGAEGGPPRVRLHAEIDGRWLLTLSAREADIRTMRLVTDDEPVPGGAE